MSQNIKVYEPSHKNKNLLGIIKNMFSDVADSRDLAYQLFTRDKKGEYRQSILGLVWAFFTPLATTLVWIFLSASGAIKLQDTTIPYPVYVFLGTMIWSIFTESLMTPLTQTQSAKSILSKVNFPKEAILLSGFYKIIFNVVIKLILIFSVLLIFGVSVDRGLLIFPFILLLLIIFGYGIGLLLTPIGMLYSDISRALPILLSFVMYLSPIVYKGATSGKLYKLIQLNPLTPLVNSVRNLLTSMPIENPLYLIIIFIISLFISFIGWLFYRVSIPIIVERM